MNIAIVEKNNIYLESLKTVLNQIDDFNVVYDSNNLQGVAQHLNAEKVDIILLDYDIAKENFSQISEYVLRLYTDIKIIIISKYSEICYYESLISNVITVTISQNAGKKEFEKIIKNVFNNKDKHLAPE